MFADLAVPPTARQLGRAPDVKPSDRAGVVPTCWPRAQWIVLAAEVESVAEVEPAEVFPVE